MSNEEKLKVEQQKIIVNSLVSLLAEEVPDLYYTDTSTIAHLVVEKIQAKSLSQQDYQLVSDLTKDDVLVLISYQTRCC
jgi:hypothetical protein